MKWQVSLVASFNSDNRVTFQLPYCSVASNDDTPPNHYWFATNSVTHVSFLMVNNRIKHPVQLYHLSMTIENTLSIIVVLSQMTVDDNNEHNVHKLANMSVLWHFFSWKHWQSWNNSKWYQIKHYTYLRGGNWKKFWIIFNGGSKGHPPPAGHTDFPESQILSSNPNHDW